MGIDGSNSKHNGEQATYGQEAKQVTDDLTKDEVAFDLSSSLPLPDLSQFLAVTLLSETFGTLLSVYTISNYLGKVADLFSSGIERVLEGGSSIVDTMFGGSSVFVAAERVSVEADSVTAGSVDSVDRTSGSDSSSERTT